MREAVKFVSLPKPSLIVPQSAGFFYGRSKMKLEDRIKRDEGLRLHLYHCPAGKLTIGVGRNIEDRGITPEEAEVMLATDIDIAEREAMIFLGDPASWEQLDRTRQEVVIQMVFNMGLTTLRKFKRFRWCLRVEKWDLAATEMLDSLWAKQVGARAERLAKEMRTGVAQ